VVNPLNLRFAPKELAYVLRDSGTKVCFVDAIFAPLIDAVKADAGLEHVVLIGRRRRAAHDHLHADLLAAPTPVIPDEGEETDPVVLMYTGGTTGLPKGVLLDQRAEMLNAYHVMTRLQFDAAPSTSSRPRCSTPRRCSGCSVGRRRVRTP
jgi:long-chain acyl-CoA synthetase